MVSDKYIKAIIYLAALAWTVILYFNHESTWLAPLSTATTVVVTAALLFDLWLWKLPFLHDWFVKRPVIVGTWKVVIRSKWIDPTTGLTRAPIEGYMVIRQTFSTLSLRLLIGGIQL